MTWFLSWLVVLELMGLAALPLVVRVLKPLPDRGYLFAKPLGLLLVGYLSWLLAIFGLLRFQTATIALVLIAVAVGCWGKWGRATGKELAGKLALVGASEALFILAFAGASLIRAYNPEISGTEKPMDFAFLNALYRTEVLPPEDPWMSGHSISYYYFGYLLLAVIAKMSNVPASVGYNLGVAVVFALLLAGSFSLSFNLISLLRPRWQLSVRLGGALLAPLMVGIMGNMEVGLEILALRGIGDAGFWQWVGVKGIKVSAQPEGWIPTTHWWWWRASRIIPTIKPDGINEFPYFSFLLGDLHPHFTSLPWTLLAIALSLAALARRRIETAAQLRQQLVEDWPWLVVPSLCLGFLLVGNSWDFPSYTGLFWLASLVGIKYLPHPGPLPKGEGEKGGLGTPQTPPWGLLPPGPPLGSEAPQTPLGSEAPQTPLGSEAPQTPLGSGTPQTPLGSEAPQTPLGSEAPQTPPVAASWTRLVEPALKQLFLTSALSILLYLPFFLGFSSQTKGIGISGDKTPLASMLIIFGPFLLILSIFLSWQYLSSNINNRRDVIDSDIGDGSPGSKQSVKKIYIWGTPQAPPDATPWTRLELLRTNARVLSWAVKVAGPYAAVVGLAVLSWFVGAFTFVLGLLLLAGTLTARAIFASPENREEGKGVAQHFIILLAFLGLFLIFVPELLFLVDLFGTRMNTVFKFHYQAWLLLGICSSVVALWLLTSAPTALRWLTAIAAVLLVGIGLLYPLLATAAKANSFKVPPTLDGTAFYQTIRPDDYAAIRWLSSTVTGRPVIVEAVGGEYSEYARVSTLSGMPTVLGWPGHEVQWRGKGDEAQRRTLDVDTIYRTAVGVELMELLHRYRVEYIYVGSLEIERYGPAVTSRFDGFLEPVHRQGRVTIYRVPING